MASQPSVGWACGWLVSAVFWSWIEKSSDFPHRFRNEKWNACAHSVRAHLQHFQSQQSYHAHAPSSVAKSSLSQLDMHLSFSSLSHFFLSPLRRTKINKGKLEKQQTVRGAGNMDNVWVQKKYISRQSQSKFRHFTTERLCAVLSEIQWHCMAQQEPKKSFYLHIRDLHCHCLLSTHQSWQTGQMVPSTWTSLRPWLPDSHVCRWTWPTSSMHIHRSPWLCRSGPRGCFCSCFGICTLWNTWMHKHTHTHTHTHTQAESGLRRQRATKEMRILFPYVLNTVMSEN